MNVLISGAGIAGLTLAFWLSRRGHTVTVVEQSTRALSLEASVEGAAHPMG